MKIATTTTTIKTTTTTKEKKHEVFFSKTFVYTGGKASDSAQCSTIEKVVICPSVTTIDDYAFDRCIHLVEVQMHDRVTKIGNRAFRNCSSLQRIQMPVSMTDIGFCAYQCCSSLELIDLPAAVTTVAPSTFKGCYKLVQVNIFGTLTGGIGDSAFYGCSSLKKMNYVSTNTTLSSTPPAAAATTTTTPTTICHKNVKIGRAAFCFCSSLQSMRIPEPVTTICEATFYGCTSLESISLPETLVSIQCSAFNNCTALTTIALPKEYQRDTYNGRFERCTVLGALQVQGNSYNNNVRRKEHEEEEERGNTTKRTTTTTAPVMRWLKHRYDQLPLHDICYRSSITLATLQKCLDVELAPHQHTHPTRQKGSNARILHATDETGSTALHLLANNMKMNHDMMYTVLDRLTEEGEEEDTAIISILTSEDKNGRTPLFFACQDDKSATEIFLALMRIMTKKKYSCRNHDTASPSFVSSIMVPIIHKAGPSVAYLFVKEIVVGWNLLSTS